MTELIGVAAAIFPRAWLSLFSSEPAVLATGEIYLHTVAPFYGIFGFGMLLYFAGQGAGRVLWPVLAGTARLIIAAFAGWMVVVHFGGGLRPLFITVALASIAFGTVTAAALWLRGWDRGAGAAEVPSTP
jgi:Na+-driven multidrug efflux pump